MKRLPLPAPADVVLPADVEASSPPQQISPGGGLPVRHVGTRVVSGVPSGGRRLRASSSGTEERPDVTGWTKAQRKEWSHLQTDRLLQEQLRQAKGAIQKDLLQRKLALVEKDKGTGGSSVTLKDISEHTLYLRGVERKLLENKCDIERRFRVTTALLSRARSSKRIEELTRELQRIRVAESQYNADIKTFDRELRWFNQSPSFLMARQYVLQNWVPCGKSGTMMRRDLLQEDESMSFDDLMQELKEEEAAARSAKPAPDAAAAGRTDTSSPLMYDNLPSVLGLGVAGATDPLIPATGTLRETLRAGSARGRQLSPPPLFSIRAGVATHRPSTVGGTSPIVATPSPESIERSVSAFDEVLCSPSSTASDASSVSAASACETLPSRPPLSVVSPSSGMAGKNVGVGGSPAHAARSSRGVARGKKRGQGKKKKKNKARGRR